MDKANNTEFTVVFRAREWVAETLEWLATEVLAVHVKHAGAAAAAMLPAGGAAEGSYTYSAFLGAGPQAGVEEKERLRADFVDTVRTGALRGGRGRLARM
jgi:hypothetical protein